MSSSLSTTRLSELASQLIPVIRNAGDLIMEIYNTDFSVETKGDASPVTEADERAEALILQELQKLDPIPVGAGHARDKARDEQIQNIPIVAEEAVAAGKIPEVAGTFWLVDPLDGTKEFISKNGEFTVNIALIDNGFPVLGLVYAPALNQLYVGIKGEGAYLEDASGKHGIQTRKPPEEGLTVVASRSHGDATALEEFLAGRKVARTVSAGSSLKLCLVAAGEADVYPRLGRTMEWDIAAGHAVLAAAGGVLTKVDGSPFEYGKPDFANPHFAAWGTAT